MLFLLGDGPEGDVVLHLHGCDGLRNPAPTDPRPEALREIEATPVRSADRVGAMQRALDKLA